jgi:multiple sugar transport system permease protein
MDGATTFQAFRFVTLPSIRPTLIVVGILQVIIGLQVFDLLYSLTSGGPGRATYVLIYAIYNITFNDLSLGYGAAVTVLLFGIIVLSSFVLLLAQVRRRRATSTGVVEQDELEDAAAQSRATLRLAGRPTDRPAATYEARDRPRRRLRIPPIVGRIAFGAGVLVLFAFFIGPIVWLAIASLQPFDALVERPPALTLNLWLDGYIQIARDPRWFGSLIVSLLTAVLTTVLVIVLAAPAAYSLARFDLPGKRIILTIIVFLLMVPAIVMAIPVLRIFQILGLTDTIAALVIVNTAFFLPLITWLLRNFFAAVPIALENAARIDGCSRLGTLFRITIPAARPGIAAAAILILIGTWNEFLFAVILGNQKAVTITRLISDIQNFPGPYLQTPAPNLLASAAMVAAIPCLLLVLLFHRRVITGLTEGFVKG